MASFLSRLRKVVRKKPEVAEKKVTLPKKRPPKAPPVKRRPAKKRFPEKAVISLAQVKAQEIITQAEKDALQIKTDAERQAQKTRIETEELRRKIAEKEAEISRRAGAIEEREKIITRQQNQVQDQLQEIEGIKKEEIAKLEKIAKLTREEAKTLILKGTEKKLSDQIVQRLAEAEEEIKSRAEDKAKEVLSDAMQRGATDYVVEYTVSTVSLGDEEMKGRVIGREGRNIRAFERATGVEIELDETNDISLSSFDPIRREIARRALEKLIKDRRIRPSRIEELVQKTKEEMDKVLYEEGEKICHQARVFRLHPDLVKVIGRFKFRFSYGQNIAAHTLEMVKIGVAIASEIGASANIVRLGCLLHDIGKVVTEEEGTHTELGVSLAKKYKLPSEVVACIAEHHEDKPFSIPESRIVWVADAISGARPGARYEPHEAYVKRMAEIEEAASGFDEVEAAYAYQAGREVRVLVKPEKADDKQLTILANKIREKLEEKVAYVGQIKITCIRESRADETTKAK